MEAVTTIIITALFFCGLAKLINAVARAEEHRKAASEAAWNDWRWNDECA